MKTEILIYGLAKDATQDYQEALLACFPSGKNDALNIEKVKQAASEAGFHSFRVTSWNGSAPNFACAVNV